MPADKLKLLLTNISGRGGISQYSYCLANALAEKEVRVNYLASRSYELNGHQQGIKVETVFEPLYDKRTVLGKAWTHLKNLRRLKRKIDIYQPTICHLHETKIPSADRQLVRWCQRRDIKIVYTAHDILHPERQTKGKSVAKFYHQVDAIIAHAQENKTRILQTFGIEPEAVSVIPLGNNLDYSDRGAFSATKKYQARQKLKLDPECPVALFFGYIREYKGLDVLLRAVINLHARGQNLNMLVAGETVADFDQYQQIVDSASHPQRFHFHRHYIPEDEASRFFLAADFVVLPYRSVYQSGVVPVAYAHARPVIASSVGGLTEVVEDGRSGRLVPPNDPEALAQAMAELLNDPAAMKRMGEFAYKLVREKYSWSSIAEETLALYKKVLAGRGQNPNALGAN